MGIAFLKTGWLLVGNLRAGTGRGKLCLTVFIPVLYGALINLWSAFSLPNQFVLDTLISHEEQDWVIVEGFCFWPQLSQNKREPRQSVEAWDSQDDQPPWYGESATSAWDGRRTCRQLSLVEVLWWPKKSLVHLNWVASSIDLICYLRATEYSRKYGEKTGWCPTVPVRNTCSYALSMVWLLFTIFCMTRWFCSGRFELLFFYNVSYVSL